MTGQPKAGGAEFEWLSRLAPLLPVEIPVAVAQGRPSADYPWFWDIHTWVEGETVPIEEVDPIQAARDLAALVGSLQQGQSTRVRRQDAALLSRSVTKARGTGWRDTTATPR